MKENNRSYLKMGNKCWRVLKRAFVWLLVLSVVGIPALPLLSESYGILKVRHFQFESEIDPTRAAQFGDFVGGFIGTIGLFVSLIVVFVSYVNQKKTNERVTFEARFFELLRYHRENSNAIEIASRLKRNKADGADDVKVGARVFVSLIREFRRILEVVCEACDETQSKMPAMVRIELSYLALYYGFGPNSTRIFEKAVAHLTKDWSNAIDVASQVMRKEQCEIAGYPQDDATNGNTAIALKIGEKRKAGKKKTVVHYCPYDGHQSRLGHYYRHMWQMMKYVEQHAPKGTAQDYADIVRAQLSNHEQALLCLNSLSSIGSAWNKKSEDGKAGYITRYGMIKNIPDDFFDPNEEFDLEKEFPEIDFEFKHKENRFASPNRDPEASEN